jgi:phosphatidylglycerophosphatase A
MSEPQSDTLSLKESFKKADLFGKVALALSSWFGAGLLPKAPGTFGTLGALPLAVVMDRVGVFYSAPFLLILIFTALRTAGLSEKLLGRDDPPEVVIDEVAGFLLTVFLLPSSWLILFFGFVLFRFFDIVKPFPIRKIEKIKGGVGVVLDDLLAGLYAASSIWVFLVVFY